LHRSLEKLGGLPLQRGRPLAENALDQNPMVIAEALKALVDFEQRFRQGEGTPIAARLPINRLELERPSRKKPRVRVPQRRERTQHRVEAGRFLPRTVAEPLAD